MSRSVEALILERAIEKMERGWTRCYDARDKAGNPVKWWSKKAVAFCAVGAIKRSTKELLGSGTFKLSEKIVEAVSEHTDGYGPRLLLFNDEQGKKRS